MTWRRPAGFLAAVIVLGLILRLWHLGADPPRWLTSAYSPLMDGPLYVAEAAAREGAAADPASPDLTGGIPPWYRKALYTALCRLVYRVAGATAETFALPSALAGAGLVPAVFVLLAPAAGGPTALLVALFVAVDAIAVGWSRTPVPYPTVALAEVLALGVAAGGLAFGRRSALRVSFFALGVAGIAVATWGLKAIAFCTLAPLAVIVGAGSGVATPSRRGAGLLAWIGLLGLTIGAAVLLRDELWDAIGRVQFLAGAPSFAGAVRRPFHLPAATRASMLAPAVVGLVLAAPILLRPGRPGSVALRVAERVALVATAAGVVVLGALAEGDLPYLLAFWPGALVLAGLALRALATGGAPPLTRPALAAGYLAAALAFTAVDTLVSLGPWLERARGPICPDSACEWSGLWPRSSAAVASWLAWFGDPYYLGPVRFLRTLLVAGAVGALAAGLAARPAGRLPQAPSPPRPGLATTIAVVHVAWQLTLAGSLALNPQETLGVARHDLPGVLPSGTAMGEHFAYALADGRAVRARYVLATGGTDALERMRAAGVTHVAVAGGRWGTLARPGLAEPSGGRAPVEVASLYVGDTRIRIARLPGVEPGSPFEVARALIERGDPAGARLAFAKAVTTHSGPTLPRIHFGVAAALAGDLEAAARTLAELPAPARDGFPARLASALVLVRRGEFQAALGELERAHERFADRNLGRVYWDLERALRRGDRTALARLRDVRIAMLVEDLLR